MVKGFGCRQAYESLSCRNPRSAFSELRGLWIGACCGRAINDRRIYESDTGELYYDSNRSAAGGSVVIAVLNPNLLLTNLDFTEI